MSAGAVFHDPAIRKLGRKAVRRDKRTLRMATYFKALPAFPESVETPQLAHLGMMGNDVLGDCTAAEKGHDIQVWTADNGHEVVVPDAEVVKFYSATTGYNPADPSTDQGGDMLTVLNGFRNIGLTDATGTVHKIGAFMEMEPKNHDHVKAACYLFGAVSIGVALPISAQNQGVWAPAIAGTQGDPTPNSWGGHDVCIVAYNTLGPICITWGGYKQMTWSWFDAYCEESYAMISPQDWIDVVTGVTPSGLNADALQADLQAVSA